MIIINEINLPPEKKTVKPVNIGGVAGGAKFIANGILFKVSAPEIASNNCLKCVQA